MWSEPPIDLSTLPREPGVYRMLDARHAVLYVGKARNLRKRVSSYFQRRPDSPRTQAMVRQVRDIHFSVTASEAEALILEHNLIKQLKPRYNVLLKDAKSYPYILLTDEAFPRLRFHRGDRSIPGHYFGPFPNAGAVHETLHQMQQVFRLRDCEDSVFRNRTRPCLQHQIGRCTAPCCGLVSREEYARQARDAEAFLRGENTALIREWEQRMQEAAARQAFEQAAVLRDRIRALRLVLAPSEAASRLPAEADAIHIARVGGQAAVCLGIRRGGRDLGVHYVRIRQLAEADDTEILQGFVAVHYRHEPPPRHLLVDARDEALAELSHTLKLLHPKRSVTLARPARGDKRRWLAQVAASGEQWLASRAPGDQQPAFAALAELMGLAQAPARLAAVDNAHLGGRQMVAAVVQATPEGPDKAHYRHYRLDGVPAGDDYAAMRAVLSRFFRAVREGSLPEPDLLLIDGGKGQLAVARECARAAGMTGLKMVGVAKGKSRKAGCETLWPSWRDEPLRPGRDSPALMLIARVRDEAHRFAGQYMRKRKKQSMFSSALEGIPGIGPARRTALLRHFGGIEGVKKASRKELARAPGISEVYAERIFRALHR